MKKTMGHGAWCRGATIVFVFVFVCRSAVAGGHFDVDDAGTLDPGQCQYEVWTARGGSGFADVLHAGTACRTGAVELGVSVERVSAIDDHQPLLGPQVKWTFWGDGRSVVGMALSGSAFYDVKHHGRTGGQVVMPVTWRPADGLQVHANVGMDWSTGDGARTIRYGGAGEWALDERFSLVAERSRASGTWTSRLGVRFNVTPLISIDVSAAHTRPGALRSCVIGLNGQFSR